MSTAKISQAEARRLRRRVAQLEKERAELLSVVGWQCPGVHVAQFQVDGYDRGAIYTAQKLGFVMIAKIDASRLNLWAIKPASPEGK